MNQQNDPQNVIYSVLPTSALAIVSLVAGILGFTIFPIIATVVAIITGHLARKETRSVPPTAGGDGLATAGIIMGYVQIGLFVIGACCFIAYFVFVAGLVFTNRS
jgi:hypothetical protein